MAHIGLPYRLEKRQLMFQSPDLLIFGHFRVVNQPFPPWGRWVVNQLLFFMGLVGIPFASWLIYRGENGREAMWGLASSILFFLMGNLGLWSWRRKARLNKAQKKAAQPGWYLVRLDKQQGAAQLIGPLEHDQDVLASLEPQVIQAPLSSVRVEKKLIPPWPWADVDVEGEDRDYLSCVLKFRESGVLDLDVAFDLLSGIQPDLRWYIHKDNPEAQKRMQMADQLLS